MRRVLFLALASLFLFFGCSEPEPPYEPVASVLELMQSVVDPATDILWASVGTIITEEETVEIFPRNDEEWAVVRNAIYVMMESGNLLMMGERAMDDEEWMQMARALVEVGKSALAAAESQDPEAIFSIGGEVYAACEKCHERYWVDDLARDDIEIGGSAR